MRAAFSSQQALDCSRVAPGAARVPETNANPQHETAHRPEADATPCRGGRNWSQIATIPGSPRPIADSACSPGRPASTAETKVERRRLIRPRLVQKMLERSTFGAFAFVLAFPSTFAGFGVL